jgi:hypothetical protein
VGFVCGPCRNGSHETCDNAGKDTGTWCDCQHKRKEDSGEDVGV